MVFNNKQLLICWHNGLKRKENFSLNDDYSSKVDRCCHVIMDQQTEGYWTTQNNKRYENLNSFPFHNMNTGWFISEVSHII